MQPIHCRVLENIWLHATGGTCAVHAAEAVASPDHGHDHRPARQSRHCMAGLPLLSPTTTPHGRPRMVGIVVPCHRRHTWPAPPIAIPATTISTLAVPCHNCCCHSLPLPCHAQLHGRHPAPPSPTVSPRHPGPLPSTTNQIGARLATNKHPPQISHMVCHWLAVDKFNHGTQWQ